MATGRGLDRLLPADASLRTGTTHAAADINRGAKADREAIFLSASEGRTITFQHPDLPSTTVAVRLWEVVGAAKGRPALKDLKDKKAPADKTQAGGGLRRRRQRPDRGRKATRSRPLRHLRQLLISRIGRIALAATALAGQQPKREAADCEQRNHASHADDADKLQTDRQHGRIRKQCRCGRFGCSPLPPPGQPARAAASPAAP